MTTSILCLILAAPLAAGQSAETRHAALFAYYEPNAGQSDPSVQFIGRAGGLTAFLTKSDIVLAFEEFEGDVAARKGRGRPKGHTARLRFKPRGGRLTEAVAIDPLPGTSHYFIGDDPSRWRRNVPHYARVVYQDVQHGVDLVFHGDKSRLEYDFVVKPGSDPKALELEFEGMRDMSVGPEGDLLLETGRGQVVHGRPKMYQEHEGSRKEVRGRYRVRAHNRIGFEVETYDTSRPLVIDPTLEYLVYFGGTTSAFFSGAARNEASGIAVDGAGNAYVVGFTTAADFPVVEGLAFKSTANFRTNAFVAKIDPAGQSLLSATFLGGSRADSGNAIALDGQGNAYVTGYTSSSDFPTVKAFQPVKGTGFGSSIAFLAKLSPDLGALLYGTYIGGTNSTFAGPGVADENGYGVAVQAPGFAYVTGYSSTTNFPTTDGAWRPVNTSDSYDAFVAKIDTVAGPLVWNTLLGGGDFEEGLAIAVDAAGHAYVTGDTDSANFAPTAPEAI